MKNRRNIIVAFLLCACLIVGIGYAALTTELYITGSANLSAQDAEDQFDAAIKWVECTSTNETKASGVISADGDTITITADGLDTVNEEIIISCKMQNTSVDLTANITITAGSENVPVNEYFKVEISPITDDSLEPGQTGTVEVSITLIKSFVPTPEITTVGTTFSIGYTATSA